MYINTIEITQNCLLCRKNKEKRLGRPPNSSSSSGRAMLSWRKGGKGLTDKKYIFPKSMKCNVVEVY